MKNDQTNLYLSGNYAPVQDELDVKDLKIMGEIPKNLMGIYMRNGPNPAFPPISYTYPFDGDGMIHAVYIANGKAHYRNRYVETKGLLKERKAGRALYGGVLKPIPMDPQWKSPEDEPVAIKNGAFIHIIRHAGRYLALSESSTAYEINTQLKTIGEWNPMGMQRPIEVCAHTRLDPQNGHLWFINYAVTPPYLTIYCVDHQGAVIYKRDIEKNYCSMIHDFVLTENYVIIFDCPVVIDIKQIMSGGPVLSWQPELGVRVGILSRQQGKMRWLQTEPFFVFHFANAYENDKEIVVDYVRHQKLNLPADRSNGEKIPPMLYRAIIDLQTETIKHIQLDDRVAEFPRIREDRDTKPHQFIYTPTRTNQFNADRGFNALIQYDVKNNSSKVHDFGKYAEIDEAVFTPMPDKQTEQDGYLMLFVYNSQADQSQLVLLDAKNFTHEPIGTIQMPRRIPHGLHGSWMPGKW